MPTPLPARRSAALRSAGPDFTQAHAALARATKLVDVVTIRDHAEAVRVACAKAKAGLALQNQAAEIRLRAERKAGQMLRAEKHQYASPGGRPRKNPSHRGKRFRTYAAWLQVVGLPSATAYRFEHDATIPDAFFERHIRTVTAHPDQELTTNGLRRDWSQQKPRVRTNVETRTGSRDARDVKRETTTWLDTFSVVGHGDPAFLQHMETLRAHFKTKTLTDTVKALVAFAVTRIRDAPAR